MMVTWPDEIEKWEDFSHLSYTIVHGKDKAYNLALPNDIYLINPEGLPWLFESEIGKQRLEHLDLLVIDESTKFKNSQSKRFKSLKPFLPAFKRRWILTGTPLPNGLEDLFGQIYTLDLGRSLGRFITHFRKEFFHLGGYSLYDWRPNPDAYERVTERISPLVLRMKAEDYLDMPELVAVTVTCVLTPDARQLYDQLDQDFVALNETLVASTKAVLGGKLRQIANGAVYVETENGAAPSRTWCEIHDAKLDALENLLEEIGPQPVLLLYEFNHDKERILAAFPEFEVLGSGLSAERTKDICDRFNGGTLSRLCGHPGSMGHGLNLQGSCHHVIWFAIPWDFELYDQAYRRVYRQGQKAATVFLYHIIAKDTKDEEVVKILTQKGATQEDLNRMLTTHRRENYDED